MLSLEPEIENEYQRALKLYPDEPAYTAQHALSAFDVLRAHYQIANHFYLEGEGLGGIGPRDMGLLSSAIHRQSVAFGDVVKWTTLFDVCATLFYGLIKNHAFYDANKRTAFLSALYQLRIHGWCPSVSEKEFEDFTVQVAENKLSRYTRYKNFISDGEQDPEVKFISWYLRKNTRRIDNTNYAVTYRELQKILHRYGFSLENPSGNHIDIVQYETKKPVLGLFGKQKTITTKIGQIGFPRWTAEVGKGAIKTVREVTHLDYKNGIDSASFFHGLDTMQTLITSYHRPLMNLANR